MKVFNSTLAAIGLAAFVFASCSDSNSDPAGNPDRAIIPADLTQVVLTSQNVDNSRVVNYKNSTANARKFFLTRAGETSFINAMPTDMPNEDAYKEKGIKILTLNNAGDIIGSDKKAFAITSQKTLDFSGKTIQNATIFIHGGSTMKYDATAGGNTFVLEGNAKLEYKGSGAMVANNDVVYVKEATGVLAATGDMTINGTLYANLRSNSEAGKDLISGLGAINKNDQKNKKITPTQNITFGESAKAFINGSIRAQKLTIGNNANIHTTANVFDSKGLDLNGNLKVDGFVQVGDFTNMNEKKQAVAADMNVNGYLEAGANSAIKVTGTLNANAGSKIVANYINVTNNPKDTNGDQEKDANGKTIPGNATLKLNGTCKIIIGNQNVINVNNLETDNSAQGQIELKDDNSVAVIKADKFVNNGAENIQALQTSGDNASFLLEFTKNYNGTTELNSFEDLAIGATYVDYDKTTENAKIEYKDENNKNYGYHWVGDASQLVSSQKLDLVASDEDPNDGESATCIQPANGKLYVTYHTNGNKNVGGSIEVASLNGKKLTIEANRKAANIDYNHLIVDGSKLFLAGSQQGNGAAEGTAVGAFLGSIDLNGANLGDNLTLYAIDKKVSGINANCVAKSGTDHVVATTNGFTIFDKDFNYWNNNGNSVGKHVVTANGKLYALTADGKLSVYDNSDMENGTTYEVGPVSPKGNKAVIAVDETNNDIYVCKGENGIAKISGGNVNQKFYECPTFSAASKNNGKVKGCANGVAVGGDKVYVACGSYGIVVLDKNTGKTICHRKSANGKSANYVALEGENIYVAYGQSRIQVYTLTTTK